MDTPYANEIRKNTIFCCFLDLRKPIPLSHKYSVTKISKIKTKASRLSANYFDWWPKGPLGLLIGGPLGPRAVSIGGPRAP
jgi:hypothetical protein